MEFRNRKIYPAQIYDKNIASESINSFGLNYCKLSNRLKNDKDLAKQAAEKNPYTVMYMNEEMRKEGDIKDAILSNEADLDKYIDPIGYYERVSGNKVKPMRIGEIEDKSQPVEILRRKNDRNMKEPVRVDIDEALAMQKEL